MSRPSGFMVSRLESEIRKNVEVGNPCSLYCVFSFQTHNHMNISRGENSSKIFSRSLCGTSCPVPSSLISRRHFDPSEPRMKMRLVSISDTNKHTLFYGRSKIFKTCLPLSISGAPKKSQDSGIATVGSWRQSGPKIRFFFPCPRLF